ncbi:hypothetical protein FRX31_007142 [Thalictrum thalictroides]|uniref:Uncharacterized protein n=1 Tax=Thalictrum thalictroides TaxID=46969 RepID=A0A7J6X4H7_THATH|nr:hypothetical protein FRX31_007142 [Thalictrum thalictroides]
MRQQGMYQCNIKLAWTWQRPMAEGNSKEAAGKRGSSGQEAAGKMGWCSKLGDNHKGFRIKK